MSLGPPRAPQQASCRGRTSDLVGSSWVDALHGCRRSLCKVTSTRERSGAMIWVVDDHLPTAAAVAEIVRGLGHSARTFAAAELACDALERASSAELCAVLITDLRMPGMDGMALLQRFRTRAPAVGVLVITAHGS